MSNCKYELQELPALSSPLISTALLSSSPSSSLLPPFSFGSTSSLSPSSNDVTTTVSQQQNSWNGSSEGNEQQNYFGDTAGDGVDEVEEGEVYEKVTCGRGTLFIKYIESIYGKFNA